MTVLLAVAYLACRCLHVFCENTYDSQIAGSAFFDLGYNHR